MKADLGLPARVGKKHLAGVGDAVPRDEQNPLADWFFENTRRSYDRLWWRFFWFGTRITKAYNASSRARSSAG